MAIIGSGNGGTLGYDRALEGVASYTTITTVTETPFENEATNEFVEIALLSSVWKDYAPGAASDPGQFTFEVAIDPENTQNQDLYDIFEDKVKVRWCYTAPDDSTWEFVARMSGHGCTVGKVDFCVHKVTLQLCGSRGVFTAA